MTLERWEEIKTNLKRQFPIEAEGQEDVLADTAEGEIKQGEAEYVIFQSPLGRLKLQLVKKPRVEEKKFHYSHRAGTAARVEYKFSDSETVLTFKAFKWNEVEDEWQEMAADAIANF